LAGLLAIGFGIPVQEFSFGNTLIVSGTVTACTGLVILGLWMVVRELKSIAQRLGSGIIPDLSLEPAAPAPRPVEAAAPRNPGSGIGGLFKRGQPASDEIAEAEIDEQPQAPSTAPWLEEAAARGRTRDESPPLPQPAETSPVAKPKRNLLFSSSSRRERERAQGRTTDPSAAEFSSGSAASPPIAESSEAPSATFEDAWPKSERGRGAEAPLPRRSGRVPSTFTDTEASADMLGAGRQPPAARTEDPPPVTVLKSGVVDGMAYSLYSDGSIEAQMPEGMMRFASIDELRAHLDQRT
jgi:hypothetical protein